MQRRALLAALLVAAPVASAQEPEITPEIQSMVRESARSWYEQGVMAERDGRTLEAEGQYRRAVDTDPGHLGAQLGYARMLDARGRRDDLDQITHALGRGLALRGDERRQRIELVDHDRASSSRFARASTAGANVREIHGVPRARPSAPAQPSRARVARTRSIGP